MLSPMSPQVTIGPSGLKVSPRWRTRLSFPLEWSHHMPQNMTLWLCLHWGYLSPNVCGVIRCVHVFGEWGLYMCKNVKNYPFQRHYFRGPAAHQVLGHTCAYLLPSWTPSSIL